MSAPNDLSHLPLPTVNQPEFQLVNDQRDAMQSAIVQKWEALEWRYTEVQQAGETPAEPLAEIGQLIRAIDQFMVDLKNPDLIVAELHRVYAELGEFAAGLQWPLAKEVVSTLQHHAAFQCLRDLKREHWSAEMIAVGTQALQESNADAVRALLDQPNSITPLDTLRARVRMLLDILKLNYGRISGPMSEEEWYLHNFRSAQVLREGEALDEMMQSVEAEVAFAQTLEQPRNLAVDETPGDIVRHIFDVHMDTRAIAAAMEINFDS